MANYYTKKRNEVDMTIVSTKLVLNIAEVMAYYNVGHGWIMEQIQHFGFPVSHKVGRKYFFHRKRIDDWFYSRS